MVTPVIFPVISTLVPIEKGTPVEIFFMDNSKILLGFFFQGVFFKYSSWTRISSEISEISSGIILRIHPETYSGIPSGFSPDILSGNSSERLLMIPSEIISDFLHGLLLEILSRFLLGFHQDQGSLQDFFILCCWNSIRDF